MRYKNKKFLSAILIVLFLFSVVSIISLTTATNEKELYESEYQLFREVHKDLYGIDVTQEEYDNLRKGFFEMAEDYELYGSSIPEFKIAYCDHVFVGRVVSHNGNFQPEKGDFPNPNNLYDVEIIELIKGPALKDTIELKQYGGYYTEEYLRKEIIGEKNISIDSFEKFGDGYYGFMTPGDSLLEVGEVYLFITTTQDDGYCTIAYPEYRIHLEDYDKIGSDGFEEVVLYKKLVESGLKEYYRIRPMANEEIENRRIL
ncbi:hypothetical protein MsAg5_11290 [Methanosarcinaceae archaeon Ag5]|uniref:Uncharacterized protein n=1 Tax=Methanolapillus africanus TaxID=3028297 RepID=A0AAE4SFE6_9EURY|nr:hypothetical protein [Methanosarcinaceae archaeon Ag5]